MSLEAELTTYLFLWDQTWNLIFRTFNICSVSGATVILNPRLELQNDVIDSSITELKPESFTWCVWPCFWQLGMLWQCVSECGHVIAISVYCPFNQTWLCSRSSSYCLCNQVIASWRSNSEISQTHTHTHTGCRNTRWNQFSLTATSYNISQLWADWLYCRILISDSLNSIHTQTPSCFFLHRWLMAYLKMHYMCGRGSSSQSSHFQFCIPVLYLYWHGKPILSSRQT